MQKLSHSFKFNRREHRKQEITIIADQTFDLFDDATANIFVELKKKINTIECQFK